MKIEYYLIDPTKNITLLVTSPVPESLKAEVSKKLMKLEPSAEQSGFVSGDSLRMSGGEFCGNAVISAAALKTYKRGAETDDRFEYILDVSGTDKPVAVSTECLGDGSFRCKVNMPKPLSAKKVQKSFNDKTYDTFRVDFGGIVHFILEDKMNERDAVEAVKQWCGEEKSDCTGIMFFDRKNNVLTPLVFVKEPPVLFWEKSCASGTAAIGAYLVWLEGKSVTADIKEPGGMLRVSADCDGNIILDGSAVIAKHNIVEL